MEIKITNDDVRNKLTSTNITGQLKCIICSHHEQITHQHHLCSIKIITDALNEFGDREDMFLNASTVPLCPNCHTYVHLIYYTLNNINRTSLFEYWVNSFPESDHKALLHNIHYFEELMELASIKIKK